MLSQFLCSSDKGQHHFFSSFTFCFYHLHKVQSQEIAESYSSLSFWKLSQSHLMYTYQPFQQSTLLQTGLVLHDPFLSSSPAQRKWLFRY
jgi:hypothetical protein